MSNEDAVDKIVKDAKDSNEFYAKLNEINLVHTFEVKGDMQRMMYIRQLLRMQV